MGITDGLRHILIICDKIQEINRLRRVFDQSFIIKATSSVQSGAFIAESSNSQLVIYHIGADFKQLFSFYRELRKNKKTAKIPLIVIADLNILKFLTDNVEMTDAHIVGTTITPDNLLLLINSLII